MSFCYPYYRQLNFGSDFPYGYLQSGEFVENEKPKKNTTTKSFFEKAPQSCDLK